MSNKKMQPPGKDKRFWFIVMLWCGIGIVILIGYLAWRAQYGMP